MPPKPIALASKQFKSKKEAAVYLRDMLGRYDRGDRVNSEDQSILMAAIQLHPEAAMKIGCGISHFSVRSADFGTKCFWLNRLDGTTDKFSYRSCITGSTEGR